MNAYAARIRRNLYHGGFRMAKKEYTKGTTTQVVRTDSVGFPLESIEQDKDGQLWHVTQDKDPVTLRDSDEVRAVFAEAENKK